MSTRTYRIQADIRQWRCYRLQILLVRIPATLPAADIRWVKYRGRFIDSEVIKEIGCENIPPTQRKDIGDDLGIPIMHKIGNYLP